MCIFPRHSACKAVLAALQVKQVRTDLASNCIYRGQHVWLIYAGVSKSGDNPRVFITLFLSAGHKDADRTVSANMQNAQFQDIQIRMDPTECRGRPLRRSCRNMSQHVAHLHRGVSSVGTSLHLVDPGTIARFESRSTGCRTWRKELGTPVISTHWMGLKTTPL